MPDWNSRRIRALVSLLLAVVVLGAALRVAAAGPARYHFKLEDLATEKDVDMCDLTDKPLIVHVWSPDCPNCQRHMPYVVGLYNKLDPDKVNFVSCTMEKDRLLNEQYVAAKHLPYRVLEATKGEIAEAFTKDGWPTTFVFAAGGDFVGTCDTQSQSYIDEMLGLINQAQRQSESSSGVHARPATSREATQ